LAEDAKDDHSVLLFNTSCILFAAGAIEARVNEWISIGTIIEDAEVPTAFWVEMQKSQKSLSIVQKWNLIAAICGGKCWDGGIEPFQSFGTIATLRNELVHFKGQLFGKDEAPNLRIADLMKQLGIRSDATFVEDDVSSWVADLLNHRKLGVWVQSKARLFYDDVLTLLLNRP